MIISTAMCVIALAAASLDDGLPESERDYADYALERSILVLDSAQFASYQEERGMLLQMIRHDPSILDAIRDRAYKPCVAQVRARDKKESD